ncbi:hypothetical protein QVM55_11080, partial [Pseudomonas monteilii]|nr:hypothetical protein [Pseudomonas monteilii]MCE0927160.1 hypothetical protein [Pseudomonas monteilii]MCE1013723.1 hypothetical protein [Pseudomonas monteilii]
FCIHPAGRPINTSIKVLRRPVESAQFSSSDWQKWVPSKGDKEIEEARQDMTSFFMRYNPIWLQRRNNYRSPIAMEQEAV